jgi:hypothetical protein
LFPTQSISSIHGVVSRHSHIPVRRPWAPRHKNIHVQIAALFSVRVPDNTLPRSSRQLLLRCSTSRDPWRSQDSHLRPSPGSCLTRHVYFLCYASRSAKKVPGARPCAPARFGSAETRPCARPAGMASLSDIIAADGRSYTVLITQCFSAWAGNWKQCMVWHTYT